MWECDFLTVVHHGDVYCLEKRKAMQIVLFILILAFALCSTGFALTLCPTNFRVPLGYFVLAVGGGIIAVVLVHVETLLDEFNSECGFGQT